MTIAIMQPYLFPYIGYFQLINAVDKFVIYDDVSFIKQGWINRNNILLNNQKHLFSIPVKNSSSFCAINETYVSDKPYHWETKLLNKIKQAYYKAPYFNEVYPLIDIIIRGASGNSISVTAKQSIISIVDYLALEKNIIKSSSIYNNAYLKSQERVIDICKKENGNNYINAIGGLELYSKENFASQGITLQFIKPILPKYQQFSNNFIPGLSIIDVLMFNSKKSVVKFLTDYELL